MNIPIVSQDWNPEKSVCTLQLEIKGDLPFFAGHFPAQPLVPGAFQIQWAIDQALRLDLLPRGPIKIRNTKFRAFMSPDSLVWLELKTKGPREITFKFFDDEQVFSMGILAT